jgi:valyl-tRNA synthetase
MTLKAKLDLLFQLQSERVQTYAIFDHGLQTVLSTGNIQDYPALCAQVTATFSVLSDSINTIRSVLMEQQASNEEQKSIPLVGQYIHRLQRLEKDKLNLTAAIHLDKIRIHALKDTQQVDNHTQLDSRTQSLLNHSILKLNENLNKVVEQINEVVEEIHAIAADL